MQRERWAQVRKIFEAVSLLDDGQREEYLDLHCGDDAELRAEVSALLRADARALGQRTELSAATPELLDALNREETARTHDTLIGLRLGAWRLQREIGRGGMGAVYLAERDDGEYTQHAAIKLVRPGWDVGELLQRFRAERQILASLSHPNIARLLDGGVSDDGKPYLVLEYVDGQAIGRYCDAQHMDIAGRLALFLTVGDAVTHAHHRLVVHRDLKPSNILVDGSGQVKLLDFGIAKLLQSDFGNTASAARMFTPEYAAPEQVRGEAVTTSVDVYALGLLLYELLTGRRPYGATASTPAAYEQAILSQEPTRPSRLANESNAEVVAHAQARNQSPERLSAQLRGDLDAIVLKALRKEPEQRYASVAALMDDVRRYLSRQPVAARRGNLRYRALRFLQRHALATALTSTATLSLIVGLGVALWQANVARHERDVARREALTSAKSLAFMKGVFQLADPSENLGRSVTAVDLLQKGAADIQQQLGNEPAVRAALLNTLGEAHVGLGLYQEGTTLIEQALQEARRLDDVMLLGTTLSALSAASSQLGGERVNDAVVLEALALPLPDDIAGESLRATLELQLANHFYRRSEFAEAERWFRQGIARQRRATGSNDVSAVIPFSSLLARLGHKDESEQLLTSTLAKARAELPAQHWALAALNAQLAGNLSGQGRQLEALPLYAEALKIKRAVYGDDHPSVDVTRHNLATTYRELGRWHAAELIFNDVLARDIARFGTAHPKVGATESGLARALLDAGRGAEAEPHWRAAMAIARTTFGEGDIKFGSTALGLGRTLLEGARYSEALTALAQAENAFGPLGKVAEELLAHTRLTRTRVLLAQGQTNIDCGEARLALAVFVTADTQQAYAEFVLGACLHQQGDAAAAQTLLRHGRDQLRALQSEDWPERRYAEQGFKQIAAGDRTLARLPR